MKLLLHPSVNSTIEKLAHALPHTILLSGEVGVGLRTIAQVIAGAHALLIEPTDSEGVASKTGSIGVEQIRELYEATRSKHERLVVVVDDADRLTSQAQGAFLKLLEEPTAHTHFILTSHRSDELLPTIHSRLQTFVIPRLSEEASDALIGSFKITSPEEKSQLRFLAHGRPAQIIRYMTDHAEFEIAVQLVRDARQVLTAPNRYERLKVALGYTTREKSLQLIAMCLELTRFSVKNFQAPDSLRQLDTLLNIHEAIDHNQSPRLKLLSLVLT